LAGAHRLDSRGPGAEVGRGRACLMRDTQRDLSMTHLPSLPVDPAPATHGMALASGVARGPSPHSFRAICRVAEEVRMSRARSVVLASRPSHASRAFHGPRTRVARVALVALVAALPVLPGARAFAQAPAEWPEQSVRSMAAVGLAAGASRQAGAPAEWSGGALYAPFVTEHWQIGTSVGPAAPLPSMDSAGIPPGRSAPSPTTGLAPTAARARTSAPLWGPGTAGTFRVPAGGAGTPAGATS